jgi:hypothetical protein
MKHNKAIPVVLISAILLSSMLLSLTPTILAQSTIPCEQCGMELDAAGQARYVITDAGGNRHYACCPICAFKLIPKFGELNITTFCDYNGPSYPITIRASLNGTGLTLYPQTAIVILGGGCTKNRLVYDSASADALLAPPNNGTSRWLPMMDNVTVAATANRMTAARAVLQYAGGVNSTCEQCGMTVDVTGQQRFRIFDASNKIHVACCPICALRLQRKYNDLNITATCDYYGPTRTISITSRNNGTDVTVNPTTALIISAASCMKNRIVYNATAADELLSPPYNGTSQYLSPLQNMTAPENSTRYTVPQAALMQGAGTPPPTPTPTPTSTPTASPSPSPPPTPEPSESPSLKPTETPEVSASPSSSPSSTERPSPSTSPSASPVETPSLTQSPSATSTPATTQQPNNVAIQICEACGMDVTAESQARYVVTDGNGDVHFVECFMCALQLANDYEILHIKTYCDWYGPTYPITVDTANFGNTVTVNPTTAMYLRGGSCVTARAAYNQTAADELLVAGYSQYTSPEQQYALPAGTTVALVKDAVLSIAQNSPTKDVQGAQNTAFLIAVAVAGVAFIAVAVVAFRKLKK